MFAKSLITTMLVATLGTAMLQALASQLPLQRIPNRGIHLFPIRPHPPVRPQVTTPSMVDNQNWTFTKPSEIARDCLDAEGTSLVRQCQSKSESDWDPDKLNTSTSTVWETCCSLFDELDCYVKNAATMCPESTQNAVIDYSRNVGHYFERFICPSISFIDWQASCANASHFANSHHNTSTNSSGNNNSKPFIQLPPDDGPEHSCFVKLRTATPVNLEQKCLNSSTAKWDPDHRKFTESVLLETCCAIYDSLNCIEAYSKSVCTASELQDLDAYKRKSLAAIQSEICPSVKYSVCTGGSNGVLPSIFTVITLFFFMPIFS